MAAIQKGAAYLAVAGIVTGSAIPAAVAGFDFVQAIFTELRDTAGTMAEQPTAEQPTATTVPK